MKLGATGTLLMERLRALEIGAAVRMRKDVPGEILFFVTGLLSIFLGVILAINPLAGVLAGVYVIGIYALLAGFFLIVLSFRLRRLKTA